MKNSIHVIHLSHLLVFLIEFFLLIVMVNRCIGMEGLVAVIIRGYIIINLVIIFVEFLLISLFKNLDIWSGFIIRDALDFRKGSQFLLR